MVTKPPKILRTDLEGKLKKEVEAFLKKRGCEVWVNKQDATTRASRPDLTFFFEGFYGMIETKKHANSPWRPGQKEALAKWNKRSWARGVWWENWAEVQKELEDILK